MEESLQTVKTLGDCERESLYKIFENCPLIGVRKECLAVILEDKFDINWLLEQMKRFLRISDLRGFFLIIKKLFPFFESLGCSTQQEIFNLLIEVSEEILSRNNFGIDYLRKALLGMCTLIEYNRDFYDSRVRKIFTEIIDDYYSPISFYSPKIAKSLEVVFCIIALTKDKTMIPVLERHSSDSGYKRLLLHQLSEPYNLDILEAIEAEKMAKETLGIKV
jgi:hypothetical protein